MLFQRVGDAKLSRADHIWYFRGTNWKCVLCGEVVFNPYSATPDDGIIPQRIEALTKEERDMAPFKAE